MLDCVETHITNDSGLLGAVLGGGEFRKAVVTVVLTAAALIIIAPWIASMRGLSSSAPETSNFFF